MKGVKHDGGKLPYHLLPFDAVDEVVAVLQHGAKKYGDRNWEQGMDWSRLLGATLRHLSSYSQGQRIDPETRLPALAHAACDLLFLLAYEKRAVGNDDLASVTKTDLVSFEELGRYIKEFYETKKTIKVIP